MEWLLQMGHTHVGPEPLFVLTKTTLCRKTEGGTFRGGVSFEQKSGFKARDGVAASLKDEYTKSLRSVHLNESLRQRRSAREPDTGKPSQACTAGDIEVVEIQESKDSSASEMDAMKPSKVDSLDRSHHRFSRLASSEPASEAHPWFGRLLSSDSTGKLQPKRGSV